MTETPDPATHPRALTRDEVLAWASAPADARHAYGEHPAQFGELYLPDGPGPHPVVILLHGGCWRDAVSLAYFGEAARDLAAHGLAVWNLEYRRLEGGGGWPATFQDAGAGADYLRALEYPLDLGRVVAVGHSAGGHLALWLAGRHTLPSDSKVFTPNPLPLAGVVALAGIPDLADAARRAVCRGAVLELLGGHPEAQPERYLHGSPAELPPSGVPQTFIHGDQDDVVPLECVRLYAAFATQRGDAVHLDVLPETGHFDLVGPRSPQWRHVRNRVQRAASGKWKEGTQ